MEKALNRQRLPNLRLSLTLLVLTLLAELLWLDVRHDRQEQRAAAELRDEKGVRNRVCDFHAWK